MTRNNKELFLLELNEINFEFVAKYAKRGELKNLKKLIDRHGVMETTSETEYDYLEPWIQWITAHSGLTYEQHKIFRLGDIVNSNIIQIWEFLEKHDITVGAVSPMNARNQTRKAKFFIPDPWTKTAVTGGPLLSRLSVAISQAVNDNANSKLTVVSAFWLSLGFARYAKIGNYWRYFTLVRDVFGGRDWAKAQILENLLTDLAIVETRRNKPKFVSLFLNAGAHIQHHYMFNATVYEGDQKNPDWLISRSEDPVLDVYRQYDEIVKQIQLSLPTYRLMIATGLHQDPYSKTKYYWRIKNHTEFLGMIGVPFLAVEPRMSRDFLIRCGSVQTATTAQGILERAVTEDGIHLFDVDNRGDDLFVMLTYPHDLPAGMSIKIGNKAIPNFRSHVAFVAIKNGEHNGVGYLIDTGKALQVDVKIPLSSLPTRIAEAFGLKWPEPHTHTEAIA